jgi:hypothetical protein
MADKNEDTIEAHRGDLFNEHHYPIVSEGDGKTANREGAKAKVVHNVSYAFWNFKVDTKAET